MEPTMRHRLVCYSALVTGALYVGLLSAHADATVLRYGQISNSARNFFSLGLYIA